MTTKKRRLVENLKTGETHIETPLKLWAETLLAWNNDRKNPCPQVVNHLIFKHPEHYGCKEVWHG